MRSIGTILAAAASLVALAAPAQAQRMHFDRQLAVETVCFTVNNENDPQPSVLYGRRFTDGPVGPGTPALVLVHGAASSVENWDFTPTWSVARALASAGYVVYAYDRLGYARSTYDRPAGGLRTSIPGQRYLLHQIVGQVRTAGYETTRAAGCSGARTPGDLRSRSVVIAGHSLGGMIVAGYPGEYRDVEAMISTAINGSFSPEEGEDDVGRAEGAKFTPNSEQPDYYDLFFTREDCEAFNVFPAGQVRHAVDVACDPAGFLISPYGDIASLGQTAEENRRNIARIGPRTDVLLSSGDHDTTAPPAAQRGDFRYYRENCDCDVTMVMIPRSGHLFQVHRSAAWWVGYVRSWLSARGLRPTAWRRPARGLTLKVKPRRGHRFRARGRLQRYTGMETRRTCRGRVAIRVRSGGRTVAVRRTRLRRDCRFARTVKLERGGRLRVRARYLGTDAVRPKRSPVRRVRA